MLKPQKKGLYYKICKKQFLLTNSGVITSILGVSGLELHFSGTEPVTFSGTQFSLGGHNSCLGAQAVIWWVKVPESPLWRWACCEFIAIYRTVTIAFSSNKYCSKSVLLKKCDLQRDAPNIFPRFPFFAKIRFNSFDSIPLSTLHLQFCDITKGIILQKFLQTKKRDY